jgi:L-lactate dehydrogenase complex protein LldG
MADQATARAGILNRIRSVNSRTTSDADRGKAVSDRLGNAPLGVVPQRGQLPKDARQALFIEKAEAVQATVERVSSYAALPDCVGRYLRERNLPAAIRIGSDPRLRSADWQAAASLSVVDGPSDGLDMAGLSHAIAGVAETGTVVLTAGADNPTTINFLPEYHLVVIDGADIEGDMEAVWRRVRQMFGKGKMSRVVNFVTGPSRSADIEQTLLLGAHGPRALHIIVVDSGG